MKPTHAEEVEVLRLQVAKMDMERKQQQCLVAVDKFAKLLNAVESKYEFSDAKGEGINFDTLEILRAPAEPPK